MNWAYGDAADRPLYDCDFRYVTRADDADDWHIRAVIAPNEARRLAAFLGAR